MGAWAATTLLDLVDGVTAPAAHYDHPTVLACPLIRRASTGPVPDRPEH